jgi:hypothetical protein
MFLIPVSPVLHVPVSLFPPPRFFPVPFDFSNINDMKKMGMIVPYVSNSTGDCYSETPPSIPHSTDTESKQQKHQATPPVPQHH